MLQAGDQIGAYTIINPIGQGGMATVYKAYHEKLDRYVAIKLLHETFLQDDDFRARFQREAKIVARLEHPGIVPIYDYAEHDGIPYLVMKFVDGMTLKRKAIKTGLTLAETASILREVATALDYAHRQGVLHRDMKPSNILLDNEGHAFITDFGLARIAEAGASTISHDMMLGTPYYISPEQAQGEKDLDSRTDIYSLGIILYELIAGRVPFNADTPYAIVHGHIYSPPTPPSDHNPQLTAEMDDVLERALEKNPADRYPTADALLTAFERTLIENPTPQPQRAESQVHVRPKPAPIPPEPQYPTIEAPQRQPEPQRHVEARIDMGDIDWRELGQRVRSGVTSLAELLEERIDSELEYRRGGAPPPKNLTREESRIRQQVRKKLQARQEFVAHLSTYLGVNGMLIFIWIFSGAGFFWPVFPLFFWGLGVIGQGYEYYTQHGAGAQQRQDWFEDEVQREMQRRQGKRTTTKEKRSVDHLSEQNDDDAVRLNEDGELTDSFIEEQRGRR